MVQNTQPIFTQVPEVAWALQGTSSVITSATTTTTPVSYDGTIGAYLLFTADATDGSFIQKIVCEAGGTNNASVARIWVNNGSTNATAANNSLFLQYSLPATTASSSTATAHIEIPLNIQLPPGYRLYIGLGAAANLASGWTFIAVGGDY